jgi:hypothetical protein
MINLSYAALGSPRAPPSPSSSCHLPQQGNVATYIGDVDAIALYDPLSQPLTAISAVILGRRTTMIRRILSIVYLLIGVLVAARHGYLTNMTALGRILSAVLAILLWTLVLFGIHLAIG